MRGFHILTPIAEGANIRTLLEIRPIGFDRAYSSGRPFEIPTELTIVIDAKGRYPDLITSSTMFVSQRLMTFLRRFAAKDISVTPVQVESPQGKVDVEYYLVTPLRNIHCLDKNASDIAYRPDGSIRAIFDFVVNCELVPDEAQVFRLGEMPFYIMFSTDLIKKMRGEEFVGVAFKKTKSSFPR
jgi:hypothetical protein